MENAYHINETHYRDQYGNFLWKEFLFMSRLWSVGDIFCRDSKWYKILRVAVADDVQHVNIEEDKKKDILPIKELCEKHGIKISLETIKKNSEDIDLLTGKGFENNE